MVYGLAVCWSFKPEFADFEPGQRASEPLSLLLLSR
jgi:hypothetical protein